MQEIIHAFGIDWRLIVIQIFNFGLLAGALWYFLYTPVLKLIAEREEKIKQGVEDALKAEKALESADAEKNVILKQAHGEAMHIVTRGTQHAEEKEQALIREASEKIARQLKNAEVRAEEIKANALKASEAEIVKMAMLAAEKVLNTELARVSSK